MQDTNPLQSVEPMIGKLLVASTSIEDSVLSRSVSLVVHQDEENVFAVLLNRPMTPPAGLVQALHAPSTQAADEPPTSITSSDRATYPAEQKPREDDKFKAATPGNESLPAPSVKQSTTAKALADASKSLGMIHFGGPLSGPVVAVHDSSQYAEAEAGKGVYVAAQRDLLECLVKEKQGRFRLIVGHLGWSIEQFHAEREAGFWHVIDAIDDDVFATDQEIWPKVIRRATTSSLTRWLGIADAPFSAEVN